MNSKRIFTLIIFFILYFGKVSAQEETVYDKIDLFGEVLEKINEEYVEEVDQSDTMDAAINGVLQSLDPYSSYMSPKNLEEMQTETKGEFGGLGIEVGMEAGVVKVISPLDNSPAEREGVKAGDYIVKINDTQVQGKTLNEAVELMRGPVGSTLEITVRRVGLRKSLVFNITREIIQVASVKSEVLDEKIGYLRLTSFNENSDDQIKKKIKEFKKNKKIEGYILDLRNNPGGLLSEAISVSDSFLELGEIVSTRGRNGNDSTHHYSRPGDIINGLPLVVLINSGSASASEIVAGALKDHKRAVLLGTRSFGKGSVQTVIPLPGHGAMRLTTARYYTPSGISIQAKGISPDIEVKVAKIEPIDFGIVREEDIRGALDKKEKENSTDIDDNVTDISETNKETSLGSELDVTEKTQDEIDFQLSRALDLIRGASVFSNLKK